MIGRFECPFGVSSSSRIQSLGVGEIDLAVRTTLPLVEAVDVKSFLAIEALEALLVVLLSLEIDEIFLEDAFAVFAAFRDACMAYYSTWQVLIFEEALSFANLLPAHAAFEAVGMPSLSFDDHGRSINRLPAILAIRTGGRGACR